MNPESLEAFLAPDLHALVELCGDDGRRFESLRLRRTIVRPFGSDDQDPASLRPRKAG